MIKNSLLQREISWLLKEKYAGRETAAFKKDLQKLKEGVPLAYLIGYVAFLNCRIYLDKFPLIPRPETEFWTDKVIEDIQQKKEAASCLDMFSGSGCIGTALLKAIPSLKVDFIDSNKDFLKQTLKNLKVNQISSQRFNLIHSNLFNAVARQYEYIVANPPYVAQKNQQLVQASVLNYEPQEALWAGKNGFKIIKPFLNQAQPYLKKNGKIYLEFGYGQKKQLTQYIQEAGFKNFSFFKDQYGKWRWVVILNY
jgi:release factor glutamine methyltransferase